MAIPAATRGNPFAWTLEFGALLIISVLGVLTLELLGVVGADAADHLQGMLLAILPVPLYVLLALWIDRYEKEPLRMLILTFAWGATGAVFFSLILNSLSADVLDGIGGPWAADVGTAVLAAPLVEEGAKGFALFLLFFWQRHEFDNVIDGILYATMVGLGFAMMENVIYYGEALQRGTDASRLTFMVRGVLTPFAHPFFTSMTGIGLGLARESTHPRVRVLAPVMGLCSAILLHSLWNLATEFGAGFFGTYALVMVPAFVALIALILAAQRRERRIIHAHLLRYRRIGPLSRPEVESLCRPGGRTRALWLALRAEGPAGWRREQRLHQAASELAFHRWRLRRGISMGAARDAAFEREHLEQLARLRVPPAELTPSALLQSREG